MIVEAVGRKRGNMYFIHIISEMYFHLFKFILSLRSYFLNLIFFNHIIPNVVPIKLWIIKIKIRIHTTVVLKFKGSDYEVKYLHNSPNDFILSSKKYLSTGSVYHGCSVIMIGTMFDTKVLQFVDENFRNEIAARGQKGTGHLKF